VSILETVRKVQEAEREADAVLAAARAEAVGEVSQARRTAEGMLAAASEAAREELSRLRARISDEESARLREMAAAAMSEREGVKERAARNHPAAVAALRELVEKMARGDSDP
jgi:vacuolar-type H+-ATPase subunit H